MKQIFSSYFYINFCAKFISLKIDGVVVCVSLAVNIVRFNNVVIIIIKLNLSVFFFYVQNEMSYTRHSIVFSLGYNFPIPDQITLGKQFPQHKAIME